MDRRELIEALFEEFDTNRDGVISRGEFKELIDCLLGRHGHETSSKIFDEFDADHDNVLSRDELIDLVIEYAI
ncbi:MAG: EF-hand domain-containing protein [Wenzhouxiangellaceae bacterium]|nr:EF-hand domain-containing protein [Wenzhouxiangellaceae bacterium]